MIRRLVIAAAAALAATVVIPTAQAQAIPACGSRYECLYQWWADREHTVFNGFRSIDCQGGVVSSGRQSGFLEFNQVRCNDF